MTGWQQTILWTYGITWAGLIIGGWVSKHYQARAKEVELEAERAPEAR